MPILTILQLLLKIQLSYNLLLPTNIQYQFSKLEVAEFDPFHHYESSEILECAKKTIEHHDEGFTFDDQNCITGRFNKYGATPNDLISDVQVFKLKNPQLDEYSSKLMIVGGYYTNPVEIIDLKNSSFSCTFLSFSSERQLSIHALMTTDQYPIMCAGQNSDNDCYVFTSDGDWDKRNIFGSTDRYHSSSVVLGDLAWFIGGRDSETLLDSSVMLNLTSLEISDGPDIPTTMIKHCSAKVSENEVFLIGGTTVGDDDDYSRKTYSYVWNSEFVEEADLIEGRNRLGCGFFSGRYVVVTGGRGGDLEEYLKSTEVMDITDRNSGWVTGPEYPDFNGYSTIIEANGELYGIGGYYTSYDANDKIYKFSLTEWILLDIRLRNARGTLDAILVPNELVDYFCEF